MTRRRLTLTISKRLCLPILAFLSKESVVTSAATTALLMHTPLQERRAIHAVFSLKLDLPPRVSGPTTVVGGGS